MRSRAGYGCAGSAYLLEPVLWSSVTVAGLFSMELLKKIYHLQLKNAGKFWSFLQEPSRGRVGSACCGATVWTLRCLEAGGFIGSVRVREQHVRVRSVRDWAVCAHFVLWAAALWACTLIAWVTLGWVTLVGMQDAGACIGRVGAGRRFSRRGAQRHLGAFGGIKVVQHMSAELGKSFWMLTDGIWTKPVFSADGKTMESAGFYRELKISDVDASFLTADGKLVKAIVNTDGSLRTKALSGRASIPRAFVRETESRGRLPQ